MAWTEAKEAKKEDIENKLNVIGGDMLKIEYLENCLKKNLTFDVRKFVHTKLAELYEKKLMFSVAAKNMDGAAEISVTYREKRDNYFKEAELWVKAMQYDRTDEALNKALACANSQEKEELKKKIKDIYSEKAKEFENINKNNNAIRIYERLLLFPFISEEEKKHINGKLTKLYSRVGKVQEAMRLEGK